MFYQCFFCVAMDTCFAQWNHATFQRVITKSRAKKKWPKNTSKFMSAPHGLSHPWCWTLNMHRKIWNCWRGDALKKKMFTYGFDCDFIFPLRILTSYKPRFQFNFFSDYLRAVSYKRDRISHIQQTCPGDGKQSQPGAMSRKYLWCRIGGMRNSSSQWNAAVALSHQQ